MFQQEISQLNLQQFKAGEKRWVGSLLGSSAALLFKEIATQNSNLYVIIARNNQHLAQLESELEFYGITPVIIPDWEILPYDRLSPHQDIVSERLAILSNMPQRVFYWFLPAPWRNVLPLIRGSWVSTLISKSGRS